MAPTSAGRWRKAGAMLQTRIMLNHKFGFGKSSAAVEPEDARAGAAGGSQTETQDDVLSGWFRQITFKRVNPSGVKSFNDIFVL